MALTLTEDVIRSRVNLTHDNLEDVKSLSLPGTYHEKIVSLGNALRKFSRLKSLDLSRNALESLEGVDSLTLLEKLNLYYNNISSLEELTRLKQTQNLKELDLRLNPVTRSEPDYRLFLVHMLPSLQKLDDRSVRDRERQAALTHYSSSQATEMTYHPPKKEAPQKAHHPRVELTSKLGKPSVLDDDDVAVLDLVAQRDGDMNRPRPLTGSAAREPAMEEYSLEMLKSMSSQDEPVTNGGPSLPLPGKKRPSSLPPSRTDNEVAADIRERYPNIASIAADDMYRRPEHKRHDPNLQYPDEVDAYSKYKSHGFFTPHPGKESEEENSTDISQVPTERATYPPPPELPTTHRGGRDKERDRERGYQDGGDMESRHRDRDRHRRTHSVPGTNLETFPTERGLPEPSRALHQSLRPSTNRYDTGLVQVRLDDRPAVKRMLFQLLDLVDRYWNGSKSLHQHAKFLSLALDAVEDFSKDGPQAEMQSDVNTLKQRVERLQEENTTLREHQARNSRRPDMDATSASEMQLKVSLKQACADVERLREELQHYMKENSHLQRKLDQPDTLASHSGSGAASSSNPLQFDDLSRQNEALSREIDGLRARLKQFAQMQELASMLQESHKSLVQTNDHLLKEMDEERRRHRHEVEQMHWSYDQLKKTMSYMPSSIKPDSTVVTNSSTSRITHTRDGGDR